MERDSRPRGDRANLHLQGFQRSLWIYVAGRAGRRKARSSPGMAQRLQDRRSGAGNPRCRRRHGTRRRACNRDERDRQPARRSLIGSLATLRLGRQSPILRMSAAEIGRAGWGAEAMATEHTVGFEPAERLAADREGVRRRFWSKFKRVVAQLPFAEDLLAAYYCAFDKQTPRHVQAALLGAIAYFILPFDFIPDMLPVLGFTDDAAILATAIRMVAGHITPDHRDAARAALKRGIDDVELE